MKKVVWSVRQSSLTMLQSLSERKHAVNPNIHRIEPAFAQCFKGLQTACNLFQRGDTAKNVAERAVFHNSRQVQVTLVAKSEAIQDAAFLDQACVRP